MNKSWCLILVWIWEFENYGTQQLQGQRSNEQAVYYMIKDGLNKQTYIKVSKTVESSGNVKTLILTNFDAF